MEEQDKPQAKQLNEVGWATSQGKKKKFRIVIVKMIHDLRKVLEAKIEKMKERFTKDLEELKNKQR